ncbi:hypothetical protein LSH36_1068g00008 [Paralvinella palmiformis]|uniref:Protein LTV1 homolog n=1 Tax=Paralvinella palmiformis TaxID=53620 RepID=A0AAD9IW08_9ANNE|nr:hypothetical protein LSH36_1068g00008 [Paralvinella palmiformis]
MPGKKKKFIDKKNAVTFHLVHRSQRDPLQAADDVPQRVLLPANAGQKSDESKKEDLHKYGVFFDDDYDYMQHLRDVNELYDVEPIESFPARTKQTETEVIQFVFISFSFIAWWCEDLVNIVLILRPKLDWDPDIVAALDEDFDFSDPDNELEDDFVLQANQPCTNEEDDEQSKSFDEEDVYRPITKYEKSSTETADDNQIYSDQADSDGSDISSFGNDLETKSRFTEYSMTSSVVPRNEGLSLLDDRFEKLYEQYDDEEIGALDHEEISGCVKPDSQILANVIEEFEKQQQPRKLKDMVEKGHGVVELASDEDEEETDLVKMVVEPTKEKWDCESILSTYSTLYNHPQLIKEPKNKPIKLTKRVGIPAGVLPAPSLTRKQLEQPAQVRNNDSANTYRSSKETAEERRLRKQAIKEERKMRREQKKANKIAFKSEKIRQEKELLNIKQNIHGLSLS